VERLREAEGTAAIADGSNDHDSADAPVEDFFDPPDDPGIRRRRRAARDEAAGRHAVAPDAMAT
jgi:hypothetical protein